MPKMVKLTAEKKMKEKGKRTYPKTELKKVKGFSKKLEKTVYGFAEMMLDFTDLLSNLDDAKLYKTGISLTSTLDKALSKLDDFLFKVQKL